MAKENTLGAADLGHGFEIEQYIRALGSSSSRVRFVMLALIISSVAALATVWGGRSDGWSRHRLTTAAYNYELIKKCLSWGNFDAGLACANDLEARNVLNQPNLAPGERGEKLEILSRYGISGEACENVCAATKFFERYGINTKGDAETFMEKQQEAFINDVLNVRTPVLGLVFDINDLGLIAGLTFSLLMLVMVFYTHRAHENLVLCMWKVQDIAEREQCFDQPGSKANLLYHALSMEQVFTIPPTLARWADLRPFRRAHYLLFVTPLFVQAVVFGYDLYTTGVGYAFSHPQTKISLASQAVFIAIVLVLAFICCAHLHADDETWDRAFLYINPAHRFKGKARWQEWVQLSKPRVPGWGLVCKADACVKVLYFSDSVYKAVWELNAANGEIRLYKRRKWRGLYLSSKSEVRGYSFSRAKWEFRKALGPRQHLQWSSNQHSARPPGYEKLPDFSRDYELEISDTAIRMTVDKHPYTVEVGGGSGQADGRLDKAGFDSINAVLAQNNQLFVTDGAWVRQVDLDGEVTTWGGKPLGEVLRQHRPLILGIEFLNRVVVSRSGEEIFTTLLVCDFSLGKVISVNKDAAQEVYASDPGWSPSGICLDGDDICLLEYWHSRLSDDPYIKILRFFNCNFSRGPIFSRALTHREARDLLDASTAGAVLL